RGAVKDTLGPKTELRFETAPTLMLFHDAVLMAVDGAGAKLVLVGPPNRYEEVASHSNVILWACRPCVDARGLAPSSLDHRVKLAGMNEFHAAAKQPAPMADSVPRRIRSLHFSLAPYTASLSSDAK